MNWKLIFLLSLLGLGMAIATVYTISSNAEPYCWLPIFLVCAYLIAKNAPSKYFLHGFMVSIINCIWITGTHILLYKTYVQNHATEAAQYAKMHTQIGIGVRKAMLLTGPFIGIISGLVLGLFCVAANKIFNGRKNNHPAHNHNH